MITAVNNRTATATVNSIDATIQRYETLKAEKAALERQARQLDKQVKALETAIGDAVDANGGLLATDRYLVEWQAVAGIPAYKSICEQFIAPGTLAQAVAATPPRQKLAIVTG